MKIRWILSLVLVVVLLAACQSSAATQTSPEGTPYPSPEIPTNTPFVGIPYPDLQDGATASWEQVQGMILSGQVTKVMQTHDMAVYVTLQDGRTLVATQHAIDDILRLIEACGDPCKDIKIATE